MSFGQGVLRTGHNSVEVIVARACLLCRWLAAHRRREGACRIRWLSHSPKVLPGVACACQDLGRHGGHFHPFNESTSMNPDATKELAFVVEDVHLVA